jgi:Tfp pilus assembly PilM family ATPase
MINEHMTSPAAKEKIAEGIHLVCHRQKLVKLADSSQLGWKWVQKYESNPLAEDSEDEKKIFKPEARAERKAKATEKSEVKKYSQRVHPYQRQNGETPKPVRPGKCFKCGER